MNNRVLVVAAHPDDEVLGMGGTIAKLSDHGFETAILIVTDGSSSQYRDDPNLVTILKQKEEETRKCAEILGISKLFYGGLPDMRLDTVPHIEINRAIERVIEEYQPHCVYTHFSGDVNKDHRLVYESTLIACRPTETQCVKRLLAYSVPSSTEWSIQINSDVFMPTWYEDIHGVYAEKKYAAMNCYQTELRAYPHPRSIEYLRNADIAEGNHVGIPAAESFMLLRCIE